MQSTLGRDAAQIDAVLAEAQRLAAEFLDRLPNRPAAPTSPPASPAMLPLNGAGAHGALHAFAATHLPHLPAGSGPRYWGFVTGGSTPAALAGDWLASAVDVNAADPGTRTAQVERETVSMLRQLFGLPDVFDGAFVSGATISNFTCLAMARQWFGNAYGVDVAQDGLAALPQQPKLFSGAPHACIYKAAAMLGVGRNAIVHVPTLPQREAVDMAALHNRLSALDGAPAIVVGNAGVVNTVDFDDFAALAALKHEHNIWLHIDAAFGGFAACSPRFAHLLAGWHAADSISIDCHKWLNVPYDSGVFFTRHSPLGVDVFRNTAAYLSQASVEDFVHRTPQNSRRFRALPAWLSLQAYGADGYREIVERCCDLAHALAAKIMGSREFALLADVRMNCACFTLAHDPTPQRVRLFLDRLQASGAAFMSPTTLFGSAGVRAAFSNWRTTLADVDFVWAEMQRVADALD